MAESRTELLSELIDRKYQCLVQLREMGRRQFELVSQGSISGVLDVLSARQELLARLQSVERALDPFRDQDPDARRWQSAEKRRQCAEQVARCETLLAEILAQEKQSEQELIRRRDEAADRLQAAYRAAQARGAYTVSRSSEIHQLDVSSET